MDDESLPFKDKHYEYWTKTTKDGNYFKKLRRKSEKPRSPTRVLRMGGGLMEATLILRRQGLKKGSIARGCGAIMSDRRKRTRMV